MEGAFSPSLKMPNCYYGLLSPAFLHLLQPCMSRDRNKNKAKKYLLVFNYVPLIEAHVAFTYQLLVFTYCPKVTLTSEGIHSSDGLDDGGGHPEIYLEKKKFIHKSHSETKLWPSQITSLFPRKLNPHLVAFSIIMGFISLTN